MTDLEFRIALDTLVRLYKPREIRDNARLLLEMAADPDSDLARVITEEQLQVIRALAAGGDA